MWYKFFAILIAIFFIWQLFVYYKANPQAFAKENLSRGVFALGILTLLLIGFVALLVAFLRYS